MWNVLRRIVASPSSFQFMRVLYYWCGQGFDSYDVGFLSLIHQDVADETDSEEEEKFDEAEQTGPNK